MRSVPEIAPVTIVQEVLTPSREITRLVGTLTENQSSPDAVIVRTAAKRAVPRPPGDMHPRFRYAGELRSIERTLDRLGKTAFLLGGTAKESKLLHHPSGRARLVMYPRARAALDELIDAMDVLPSLEERSEADDYLYVQFGVNALIRDIAQREEALDKFNSRLRHPGMKPYLTATQPRLVLQDTAIRLDRPAA